MKRPESSQLAKANTVFACVAYVVYVVGFGTPNWLQKDFMFPLNKGGVVDLPVYATIGLLSACKVETYPNGKTHKSCSPDGAAEWQIIAAALAITGLVLGLLGVLLSVFGVVSRRLAGKIRTKLAILFCILVTCGFSVGPLLLFPMNKKIQVQPDVSPFQVDFDLGWSYTIGAVSTGLFAALALLNLLDIIWSDPKVDKEEDRQAFSKYPINNYK